MEARTVSTPQTDRECWLCGGTGHPDKYVGRVCPDCGGTGSDFRLTQPRGPSLALHLEEMMKIATSKWNDRFVRVEFHLTGQNYETLKNVALFSAEVVSLNRLADGNGHSLDVLSIAHACEREGLYAEAGALVAAWIEGLTERQKHPAPR